MNPNPIPTAAEPALTRYAQLQRRLAQVTTIMRVRGDDAVRATLHGNPDSLETAIAELEDAVRQLERTLGITS